MTKPHHHGNLRAALITAGLELLREGGVAGADAQARSGAGGGVARRPGASF
jgi:hypothetical protein